MKVLITSQGIVKGENPDYKFPIKPYMAESRYDSCYKRKVNCHWPNMCAGPCGHATQMFEEDMKDYESDLKLAEDHAPDFEDQNRIYDIVYEKHGYSNEHYRGEKDKFKPGLYDVDVETEMIWQYQEKEPAWNKTWKDLDRKPEVNLSGLNYRQVLRIVEKKL